MTLHCDLRFEASDARLGQPEIRIGFIPPIATTQALARLIERSRAIHYLYEGKLIAASDSYPTSEAIRRIVSPVVRSLAAAE